MLVLADFLLHTVPSTPSIAVDVRAIQISKSLVATTKRHPLILSLERVVMSRARETTMANFPRRGGSGWANLIEGEAGPITLFVYATMNGYKAPVSTSFVLCTVIA